MFFVLQCTQKENVHNWNRRCYFDQTINSVESNSLSLKYQRCKPSGCKDMVIRKFACANKKVYKVFACIDFKCIEMHLIVWEQIFLKWKHLTFNPAQTWF